MNWKNRILNKVTLISLIGVVIYFIFKLECLIGLHPDAEQYRNLYDLFACAISGLAILGIIVDPNTPGVSDGGSHEDKKSEQQINDKSEK